ncbi:hypothetical protein [Brevundimonas sp.]
MRPRSIRRVVVPAAIAPNGLVPKGLRNRVQIGLAPTARIHHDLTARIRHGPIDPTDPIGQTARVQISPALISPVLIVRTDLIAPIVQIGLAPTGRIVPTDPTDQIVLTDRIALIVLADLTGRIARIGLTVRIALTGQIVRTVPAGTTTATVTAITGSSVVASTASNGGATGIRTATATGGATTGASGAIVA